MIITVFVTVPSEKAELLTKALLSERVCACVNIVGEVKSFFWWKGKIDEAKESLLIIKTKETLFGKLKELIKNNHPYSTPEVIGFKVDQVNKEYLDWVIQEANAAPYSQ
jgi:periplasmic divalent cation tolerance protein